MRIFGRLKWLEMPNILFCNHHHHLGHPRRVTFFYYCYYDYHHHHHQYQQQEERQWHILSFQTPICSVYVCMYWGIVVFIYLFILLLRLLVCYYYRRRLLLLLLSIMMMMMMVVCLYRITASLNFYNKMRVPRKNKGILWSIKERLRFIWLWRVEWVRVVRSLSSTIILSFSILVRSI